MEASNSEEMDDSVAALFEEPRPPASFQSTLEISAESSELDLKQLLTRTTMELESARSQAKLYESELCLTKNLLNNVRQERDAAREEVVKLKGMSFFSSTGWLSNADAAAAALVSSGAALNAHGMPGGDAHEYSLHIQHSSKASSSPGQHMQLDCVSMLDASKTHLSDLHWDLHDLPALRPIYPDVQSNNLSPLLCGKGVVGGGDGAGLQAAVVSMEMDQHSDHEHMQQESAIFSEANVLLEQEVQLAGFQGQQSESNDEFSITDVLQQITEAPVLMRQWGAPPARDINDGIVMPQMLHQEELTKPTLYHTLMLNGQVNEHNRRTVENDLNEFLSRTDGGNGSANMSIEDQQLDAVHEEEATTSLINLNSIDQLGLSMETPWLASEYAGDLRLRNVFPAIASSLSQGIATDYVDHSALDGAPNHLPEPPEADPEVMLRSLPERGKLLQSVMQAGPLLQTLLVAGPLPRWRRPPPAAPVDPMESRLMMQCCNNVGNSSISYNYSMHNSHFPMFPIPSSMAIVTSCSSGASQSCAANIMSTTAGAVGSTTSSVSALATIWMKDAMSSVATTTAMTTTTTKISTVMEPSLLQKSNYKSLGPMLNTSTNVSYSSRLLRSSALLPKRLNFSKHRH